ncbi:MAG: homoserine acetyltransferase, partial [Myxococcota bacterium]
MKHRTWASVAAATILFAWFTAACAGAPPTVVSLGDFALESGKTLNDCRIAYRTMGTLNPQGSNAVLVTTWLAGTSQEMIDLGFVGPGKAVNTDRFYAIIVDALGNGVSSSPSNSKAQPGAAFPAFTTADLVRTQYELLKKLGIKHLYAVTG